MKLKNYIQALGVALVTIMITVIVSFPMVTFYAYVIEPGHDQEFYEDAAQWIAPWSSYILGPILFYIFNYWLTRRSVNRNNMFFAIMTIVFYIAVECFMLLAMDIDVRDVLFTLNGIFWISIKLVGALLGAYFGQRNKNVKSEV